MTNNASPLIVNVYRGNIVESSHLVHAIVMDRAGDVVESWGDVERPTYPRSSLKALQALPFVESGAVDAFGLGDAEIALACASHNAEQVHIEKVTVWLEKVGLDAKALLCGGHLSINQDRAHEMIRNGETLTALYSDCSGKHAGMVTTAVHQGHPIVNYTDPNHPVQRQILQTISEMADYDLTQRPPGIDGCSAPNPALPLKNIALAFSRFMNLKTLPSDRAVACGRILDAIAANPYMIGGKARFDTVLIESSGGNLLSKLGAEGNCLAFVRDQGLTIYLKAEDGIPERATLPVLSALLNRHKAMDDRTDKAVEHFTRPVLKNWRGLEVGKITVPDLLSL